METTTLTETSLKKNLAKNLRRLLCSQNKSPEKFAREHGVSKTRLYTIIKGEANVSLDLLEKIASGLGVSPMELLA